MGTRARHSPWVVRQTAISGLRAIREGSPGDTVAIARNRMARGRATASRDMEDRRQLSLTAARMEEHHRDMEGRRRLASGEEVRLRDTRARATALRLPSRADIRRMARVTMVAVGTADTEW
jgi:hypothetical protein